MIIKSFNAKSLVNDYLRKTNDIDETIRQIYRMYVVNLLNAEEYQACRKVLHGIYEKGWGSYRPAQL